LIKVARLEAERVTLRQSIEECSIAGILLGLHQTGSEGKEDDDDDNEATFMDNVNSTKDARLLHEQHQGGVAR
jgi:hypothetical protein